MLQTLSPAPAPLSLDLHQIGLTQRERLWRQSAPQFFPGLSVRDMRNNPPQGSIHGRALGPGQLWTILSPPAQVSYKPRGRGNDDAKWLSVMLQLQGSTRAWQDGRLCNLNPQDLCIIDGQEPFELEVTGGFSRLMFLRLPRSVAFGRHPYLERQTAQAFDPNEAGAQLLRTMLLGLLESAPSLREEQGTLAITGAIHLLGLPRIARESGAHDLTWRSRAALALIDAELSDHSLTATRVAEAQGISRRRLDQIVHTMLGTSVSAQIWLRRLNQAAEDLRDSRLAKRSVTQIAYSVGFTSTAHFTRAFKRQYHCTPLKWRQEKGDSQIYVVDVSTRDL
ncbi:MAG: helix-turn-helix domain-containing protein [Gammaproteobacteria bacterium]